MYVFAELVRVCADVIVMPTAEDMPYTGSLGDGNLQCKCSIVWVKGRHLEERQF